MINIIWIRVMCLETVPFKNYGEGGQSFGNGEGGLSTKYPSL